MLDIATPTAKLKVKVNGKPVLIDGKPMKVAYAGDETDPAKIKQHILDTLKISVTSKKNPNPTVEADGDLEFFNADGSPFTPEPTGVPITEE